MLGKPLRIYHPQLVASGVGLGVVGIGAAMLWYMAKAVGDMPFATEVFAVFASLLAVILAVAFVRQAKMRVIAHEGGVAWTRGGEKHEVAFAEVRSIRELGSSVLIYRKAGGKPLDMPTTVVDRDQLLAHLNVAAAKLPKATARAR